MILDLAVELFITTDLQDLIVAQLEHLRVDTWRQRHLDGILVLIHNAAGLTIFIKAQPLTTPPRQRQQLQLQLVGAIVIPVQLFFKEIAILRPLLQR